MPKPFPREFREDVVRVARSRDSKTTIEQVAKDFGIHATRLANWMRRADVQDGEHGSAEGKPYVCAIKDVYSNRVVGYSIDIRMKSRIAVAALNNAVARRGDVAGCVLHTDRGSQFRSRKLVHALNRHHMV